MCKFGFFVVFSLALVFTLDSCDTDQMSAELGVVSPENEGLQYLTVTYHSEGHTSGEPPVDSRRYVVPRKPIFSYYGLRGGLSRISGFPKITCSSSANIRR